MPSFSVQLKAQGSVWNKGEQPIKQRANMPPPSHQVTLWETVRSGVKEANKSVCEKKNNLRHQKLSWCIFNWSPCDSPAGAIVDRTKSSSVLLLLLLIMMMMNILRINCMTVQIFSRSNNQDGDQQSCQIYPFNLKIQRKPKKYRYNRLINKNNPPGVQLLMGFIIILFNIFVSENFH